MRTLLCLLLVACGSAAPNPPTMSSDLVIPPAAVPPHGTLLLGDLHGTREIPAFVGRVLETVSAREPVVFALEITREHAGSLATYLASDGGAAARTALLATAWWQIREQDGRRSVAMLALIETVRRLRNAGRDIELVTIDAAGSDAESREETMANHVIAARRARADATLVVYAGNLHTSKREVAFKPGFAWMAMRVEKAGIPVVSLDARWHDGTAWVCRGSTADTCGVSFAAGRGGALGIHLEAAPAGRYDGWFGVGTLTASPPAAIATPNLDAQIAAALRSSGAVGARARRAYDAGRYDECAAILATIEAPDAGTAYDHACCLARAGRKDEALERLTFALSAGFADRAHAEQDADLASLRDDPRWPLAK